MIWFLIFVDTQKQTKIEALEASRVHLSSLRAKPLCRQQASRGKALRATLVATFTTTAALDSTEEAEDKLVDSFQMRFNSQYSGPNPAGLQAAPRQH